VLDLAHPQTLDAAHQKALEAFGKIDILVNNGGVSTRDFAVDIDFSVDVTVSSMMIVSQKRKKMTELDGVVWV
jgi:NADP-dependent 3-hydroxy acid dehydrogenase YdfG